MSLSTATTHGVLRSSCARVPWSAATCRMKPGFRRHCLGLRAQSSAALRPSLGDENHVLREWPSPLHRQHEGFERSDASARETAVLDSGEIGAGAGAEEALRAAAPIGLTRVATASGTGAHSGYDLAVRTVLQSHGEPSTILSMCSSYLERDPGGSFPEAVWPKQKYPLPWNVEANVREEQRCLAEVERLIEEWPVRVSAMLVEPVFTRGATQFASASFFRSLYQLLQDMRVWMIVDERRTGFGTTGSTWAFERWGYPIRPDAVVFESIEGLSGYYYRDPALAPALTSTSSGMMDQASQVHGFVSRLLHSNFAAAQKEVGNYLFGQLEHLAVKHEHKIRNLRGRNYGMLIAWDCDQTDDLLEAAAGLDIGVERSGTQAVRIRSTSVPSKRRADELLGMVDAALINDTLQ